MKEIKERLADIVAAGHGLRQTARDELQIVKGFLRSFLMIHHCRQK